MAKVSVIMATYNCADTVTRAIDSIINQTMNDWEFIICDDCSTDKTYEILLKYKKQYPGKIKVIKNKKNSKLAYSLNHCLKYASGEYIARMDADDESLPERFEKQCKYLDANDMIAVVGTSMQSFDETGDGEIHRSIRYPEKYVLYKRVPFFHATIMMRKTAFDKLNGYTVLPRTERGQDLDLWFRFFAAGFTGDNLEEVLYRVLEDKAAFKRRKLKYCWHMTKTRYLGFRLLKFPVYKYYLVIHPIVSYFVPLKLKRYLRSRK